jgi:DNA-3-methyladenine glycosylase
MPAGSPLPRSFFERDVRRVARDLIGCSLLVNGVGGVIVETEAYNGNDPACHAYRGMTDRNRVMFGPPGRAYVYFTYGMHHLFNIVCEQEGVPAGVLIRALEPTAGIEAMRRRRAPVTRLSELANGPAKITQALAIGPEMYGKPVYRGALKVFPRTTELQRIRIEATPRIGIRVGTRRKWRFCATDSRYLSRKPRGKGAAN